MNQLDQMSVLLKLRYGNIIGKMQTQKIHTFTQNKHRQFQKIPLHQAILIKKNVESMSDTYDPFIVEQYWDQWWNYNKFFHADSHSNNPKKFTICLPPPNITGYLHIGHALTVSIEDSIVRRKRMQGYQTLFLPGTDHAGIATQSVVEKQVMKTQGLSKYDLGRDKFVQKIWDWKQKHGNGILNQLRRVGASLDWDRLVFTMDKQLSESVAEGFVRMFERGLIYRENRLVNWSVALKTAISDMEVQYIDIDGRTMIEVPQYNKKVQFGVIIYFAYKRKDDQTKQIEVATTRIETMLGDVAVAVHPQDERYKEWIGKQLLHPFIPDRKMRVIGDTFVDREFGTGAVKITPAHDPNDYSCGNRNALESINIMTDEGLINGNGGKFEGMKRFECRRVIEEQLKKLGLWKDKKNHKMRLGLCSRSGDVIEPIIKPQWYVKCGEISKKMIEVVKSKELKIIPSEEQQTWYRWISNLKDWCISRQLWWGHRIPAYLIYRKGQRRPQSLSTQNWIAARNEEQALIKASGRLKVQMNEIVIEQDEDVLDTWFSSGLFPFSPLKWPNSEQKDYRQFFPNSLLQTGHDILFFWVARMVMMSLWLTQRLPFKQVLLHPLVCDSEGNKMSKSRGNVIDPLEFIEGTSLEHLVHKIQNSNLPKGEQIKSIDKLNKQFKQGIPQCGSDALRFGLLNYLSQSRHINLNINVIITYRKFCNKIWNSFKFAMTKFQFISTFNQTINPTTQNFLNSWILAKLDRAIVNINKSFDKYQLGDATAAFYNFWLYQLCDVYLEATKPLFLNGSQLQKQTTAFTLFICLHLGIKLLHPMMPFLSEELYQKLPPFQGKSISITKANYPHPFKQQFQSSQQYFLYIQNQFQIVNKCAAALRSIASSVNLPPQTKPNAYILTKQQILLTQTDLIATLGKCNQVIILKDENQLPKGCGASNVGITKLFLDLGSHINIEKEIERLSKKLEEIRLFKEKLEEKMKGKNRDKIPMKVKEQEQAKLQGYEREMKVIYEAIERVNQLK